MSEPKLRIQMAPPGTRPSDRTLPPVSFETVTVPTDARKWPRSTVIPYRLKEGEVVWGAPASSVEQLFSLYCDVTSRDVLAAIDEALGVVDGHPTNPTPTSVRCAELLARLHALHPEATFSAEATGYRCTVGPDGIVETIVF